MSDQEKGQKKKFDLESVIETFNSIARNAKGPDGDALMTTASWQLAMTGGQLTQAQENLRTYIAELRQHIELQDQLDREAQTERLNQLKGEVVAPAEAPWVRPGASL